MLPMRNQQRRNSFGNRGWFRIPEYLKRIFNYGQMDLEYSFWQMFYLCINPSRVYRTSMMHKQIKNQWARDDPAFAVILCYFIIVSSFCFAIAFSAESFSNIFRFVFLAIFVDFIGLGISIASFSWWLTNKYLKVSQSIHNTDQKVEWMYAFDVHFPLLIENGFIACFVSNSLYAIAFIYYFRLTWHGYSALPFLQNTQIFLYPIALVGLLFLIGILTNFNMSIFAMNFRYD